MLPVGTPFPVVSDRGFNSRPPAPFSSMVDVTRLPFVNRPAGLGITRSGATSVAFNMAGSTLLSLAPTAGPLAPWVAAAGAVALLGGQIARMFSGCGQSCVLATQAANDWSDAVNQIKAIYWNTPTPRPRSFQQATLQQLTEAADWLRQACSDPSLGDAGRRCISERIERGGTAPWCPTADHKGCDFYTTIYDPIANDPDVQADPPGLSEASGGFLSDSFLGGGSADLMPLLLLGGLVLLVTLL